MILRALGGAPLKGEILARNAYIDEAGISNKDEEPIVVVAGIILHLDDQWRPLHEHFNGLVERFIAPEHREGFIFHAKDIWHGSGKAFNRELWKDRDRRDALRALCESIVKFQLPIPWGACKISDVEEMLKADGESPEPKRCMRIAFMRAFADCASRADQWIDKYSNKECIGLVLENNNELKKFAKVVFKELRNPNSMLLQLFPGIRRIEHVIDAPSFMDKEDAPPLQLADACAFIIKRYLCEKGDVNEFMRSLMPSMLYVFPPERMDELHAEVEAENLRRQKLAK